MTAQQKIEKAMANLTKTINENGYIIEDVSTEEITDKQVELYRYPPDTYDMAVVAAPKE